MMQTFINKYLSDIKESLPNKRRSESGYIDLEAEVSYLLHTDKWSSTEEALAHTLARKVEITKKFDVIYTLEWKKHKSSKVASGFLSSLATFVLYVSFKKLQNTNVPIEVLLKRMNAIFKALDVSKEKWIDKESILRQDIEHDFDILIDSLPLPMDGYSNKLVNLHYKKKDSITIPITILYSEGPIARAYLETFKSLGLKPRKIIHMISNVDIVTRKPIGKFLPLKYRIKYAAHSEESKINFWPRQIEKKYPELQKGIFREVSEKYNIPLGMLSSTTQKLNLSDYCERIESILVSGLKDKKLEKKLTNVKEGAILYTGGGIVPPSLLSIEETKFIHIHPGFLPDIKGADCTLWSSLLFGKASASCFYMSPGIDTGDIIMPRWMPKLSFNISISEYDYKTLYRAIYSYLDPWVRSVVLREFLSTYMLFDEIETVSQDEYSGYTYYFMHDKIKFLALTNFKI